MGVRVPPSAPSHGSVAQLDQSNRPLRLALKSSKLTRIMKTCSTCKRDLLLIEFTNNRAKPDGKSSACRRCKSVQQAAWYRSHAAVHMSNVAARSKIVMAATRKKVLSYLLEHPCVDCGESDPIVLDFDHVRGRKIAHVSVLISNHRAAWSRVFEEIQKCVVRCANCHRRKTARLGRYWRAEVTPSSPNGMAPGS